MSTGIGYPEAFELFCRVKLRKFYEALGDWYGERGKTRDSMSYFRNHWPRFNAMIELCHASTVRPWDLTNICEIGSFFPYTAYYWKWLDASVTIDLFDIIIRELAEPVDPYDIDGVRLYDHNLCTEPLPEKTYDLVILSEVLEHLPINLFTFCDSVVRIVAPGGYLLVSYPLGGRNAKNYGVDLPGHDLERLQEPHLREFTDATTKLFFTDLSVVDERFITYPAYGRMKLCLYRR